MRGVGVSGVNPYDLGPPRKPLLPHMAPLLSGAALERARAVVERDRRERQQQAEVATAEAVAQWEAVLRRFESRGETLGVAVLDLHRPQIGFKGAVCSECLSDEDYEATSTTWPCATYRLLDPSIERGGDGA